jgi:hypothetical protein
MLIITEFFIQNIKHVPADVQSVNICTLTQCIKKQSSGADSDFEHFPICLFNPVLKKNVIDAVPLAVIDQVIKSGKIFRVFAGHWFYVLRFSKTDNCTRLSR